MPVFKELWAVEIAMAMQKAGQTGLKDEHCGQLVRDGAVLRLSQLLRMCIPEDK